MPWVGGRRAPMIPAMASSPSCPAHLASGRGRVGENGHMDQSLPEGEVLPTGYAETLEAIKAEVRSARIRVARTANTQMIELYWRLGRLIVERQLQEGRRTRVIAARGGPADRVPRRARVQRRQSRLHATVRHRLAGDLFPTDRREVGMGTDPDPASTESTTGRTATGTPPGHQLSGGPATPSSTTSAPSSSSASGAHPTTSPPLCRPPTPTQSENSSMTQSGWTF